jgi:glutathione S-transferase
MRVLWMAAEVGVEFEHDPIAFDDPGLKSDAFLQRNPAGAIPTLEDDGFALPESLAINLYLAKRYALGSLYPASLQDEAQVWRWSLWAQGQLEPGCCATPCWPICELRSRRTPAPSSRPRSRSSNGR